MAAMSSDELILGQASRDMHNVYTLLALLLILAVVWRLGSRPTSMVPLRKRMGGGVGNSPTGVLIGFALGWLAAQAPRVLLPSGQVEPRGLKEEPQRSTPCVEVNRTRTPLGTEGLPPGIIVPTTDLYLRRLWGKPEEDLPSKPAHLLVLTVGFKHAKRVNQMVAKFRSKEWQVLLFHEDGRVDDWLEYEWANRAIHVVVQGQSKWWFAKRFLHPDVVLPYEYILLWDPNLDLTHLDPTEYLRLVRTHGLEVSQPAVEAEGALSLTWQMTKRREGSLLHRQSEEKPGWCKDPQKPPCAGFVEIQAPVFSRRAWRCTWHMIQNDLVHGWGLDFNLGKCAQGPPHEKVGVVDAEFIRQLKPPDGRLEPHQEMQERETVLEIEARSKYEWDLFKGRMAAAEEAVRKRIPEVQPRVILTR